MNQQEWTRRRFLRAAVLAALGGLAAACGQSQQPSPSPEPTTLLPTQSGERVLSNENRPEIKPDWNIRYFQPYRPITHDEWRLTVEGLVEAPHSLSLNDLLALPRVEQDTRMKCVECWSARACGAAQVRLQRAQGDHTSAF